MSRKLSEFPDFVGRDLLMLAEKRGLEVTGGELGTGATAIILIGLVSLMAERNIGGINELTKGKKDG